MNDSIRKEINSREKEKADFIISDLLTTLEDLEDLLDWHFEHLNETDPNFVMRINLLSFISKLLEVNINFLRNFVCSYNSEEPTIPATFARGIFELHLILLEALSDKAGFLNVLVKAGDAYESFMEIFLQIAKQKGDANAVNIIEGELVRITQLRKKFEKTLNTSLKSKEKRHPYLNFKELAKKHGLLDVYEIEYSLLSSFIHPSLLYLITTEPKDKTIFEKQRQLAKFNVKYRRQIIKTIAAHIAFEVSSRTISKVRKFLYDCRHHL
jgi:AraC-like DNA-binding protein